MNLVKKNINTISELCQKHKVKTLYAFGSVLTDKFTDKSDIDLLVSFKKMPIENYADNYFEMAEKFEQLFNRPIDLVTENSLKNPYFIQSVNNSKQLIYGN
jgi:predicted nucleotidyltransferase